MEMLVWELNEIIGVMMRQKENYQRLNMENKMAIKEQLNLVSSWR